MPPPADPSSAPQKLRGEKGLALHAVEALASLRLTVALFALAIFLVFVGTLAQVDHDIWYVVEENYFRVWFATVEWQAFYRLVEMFTKSEAQPISGGFLFPGGKLIGVAMFANLLAAHAVRFKVAAKGKQLSAGLGVLGLGVVATIALISGTLDSSFAGELSPSFCNGLWQALRAGWAGLSLYGAYWVVGQHGKMRPAEWWLAATLVGAMLALSVYLFVNPSASPDDSGMRIVWQLTKCGGAAALTLAGCWMVFRKRAGIVLLHAGVGLLMVGELVTDLGAVEGSMRIPEGGTVNYAEDIRHVELAVVAEEADAQRVTVVPENLLRWSARSGEPVSHPDLPFDVRVVRYDLNSRLATPSADGENLATAGVGLQRVAVPAASVSGVAAEAGINLPSAYVELLDKRSGDSLGTWLVSSSFLPLPSGGGASLLPQPVPEGSGSADLPTSLELRFKRLYKPYSVTLEDFRFDRYAGTNVPKNFQSDIVLRDPSRGVERPVKIYMNNPLRYGGDTLYQQSYDEATEAATVLQVVTNGGWKIPYVSWAFVCLGMVTHFGVTLGRFTRRRSEEAARKAKTAAPEDACKTRWSAATMRQPRFLAPAVAALLVAGYFATKARPKAADAAAAAVQRFGALPVADGGRVKPIDTLARTTLQAISARQEVLTETEGRLPATEWLLDCVSDRKGWRDHRVFRIENGELLDALGLEQRPGSFRYSYGEVMADPNLVGEQLDLALAQRSKNAEAEKAGSAPEPLSAVQRQTLSLADKLSLFHQVVGAFVDPVIGGDGADVRQQLAAAQAQADRLRATGAPRVVPPGEPSGEWLTLYHATLINLMRLATGQPIDQGSRAWNDALAAYAKGDFASFDGSVEEIEAAVASHQRELSQSPEALAALAPSERLDAGKVRFERFFSHFSPFYYCAVMYLIAFVLTAVGWLSPASWSRVLGRTAMAVVLVTLAVHTFALFGRVYISGRPPVTNLYSSAVFIGWAAVLFGVAFEAIYRLGIGAAVSSLLGFMTLLVAHFLSLDGDTYTVLRAVLDTQFWLATHVVCISLGYSTVYLAGFLGVFYLGAMCGPRLLGGASLLDKSAADQLVRMIYGTLCFALLFSFVGTVLGGLWADDSWGRFWGWDPKENGALIIVLWVALVLHARWGRMVGPVGLSCLAVGGNIVTTWSWFGVNELGVGLHAYGDSESSTALWLLVFAVSQLAMMALALAPPKMKNA